MTVVSITARSISGIPNAKGRMLRSATGYLDGPKLPEVLGNQGIRTELLDYYDQPLFNFASEDEKIIPQGENAQGGHAEFLGFVLQYVPI